MGAFNELLVGDGQDWRQNIQFKFGERRQHQYRIGDKILPSFDPRSEVGEIEVPGIGGDPPDECRYYAILFRDGVIVSYREISEAEYDRLDDEVDALAHENPPRYR